jgi:asparagine synthase (glutamine-hydrolysing)
MIPVLAGLVALDGSSLDRHLAEGTSWRGEGVELAGRLSHHGPSASLCLGSARLDNRRELIALLDLSQAEWGSASPRDADHDDTHLIHRAWLRWGEDCVERLLGDWAFAIWNQRSRSLFLARDHYGITSLYYALGAHHFGFASELGDLLALDLVPPQLDEGHLARLLLCWHACIGAGTVRVGVQRLPPAHCLHLEDGRLRLRQYWFLERTPPLAIRDRREAVEGFLELFDQAVACRLRRDDGGKVASTLSAGLDSGAISVTAASQLAQKGERLQAFTAVPSGDVTALAGDRLGNEWPLAAAAARGQGQMDHHAVTAEALSPLQGFRQALAIHGEPLHAAGNKDWLICLNRAAVAQGCTVLLIGQSGNGGISWQGRLSCQPGSVLWRHYGPGVWLREQIRPLVPPGLLRDWQQWRVAGHPFPPQFRLGEGSALNPDLLKRLDLERHWRSDSANLPPRTAIAERFRFLLPGRIQVGALHAEAGRAAGLEVRDPSADARVLSYTWSLPDRVFIDSETGKRRWLLREAMAGRLCEAVRTNEIRGLQGADQLLRLRKESQDVETALELLARSPLAQNILDVPMLTDSWRLIERQEDAKTAGLTANSWSRGMMVGLFLADWPSGLTGQIH